MLPWDQSSNRIDDEDDAQSENDALEAPLLPEDEDAHAAAEALHACCERGLVLVRWLMIYLLFVSAGAGVLASVAEWVVVAARRAHSTDDDARREWWSCLCDRSIAAHWVDSSQPEKLPVLLAATLLQSVILAGAGLLVTQRACVRRDGFGSALVNVLFLTLAILLPPAAAGWPAPTAISSSLSTLAFWAFRPFGDECKSSRRFARACVGVAAAALATNLCALVFLVVAARARRRTLFRGKRDRPRRPRAVAALGGAALATYTVAALSRLGVSILAQWSFDASFFDRWSVVAYVAGQPGFQIAGATAFASVAMAVRGAHRSNLQIAVLLGAVSLYVNLPAFVATADAARRRGLWFGGVHHCADEYLARHDAADMYGRPSPGRALRLCRYIVADLWGTALHLLFCSWPLSRRRGTTDSPVLCSPNPSGGRCISPRRTRFVCRRGKFLYVVPGLVLHPSKRVSSMGLRACTHGAIKRAGVWVLCKAFARETPPREKL